MPEQGPGRKGQTPSPKTKFKGTKGVCQAEGGRASVLPAARLPRHRLPSHPLCVVEDPSPFPVRPGSWPLCSGSEMVSGLGPVWSTQAGRLSPALWWLRHECGPSAAQIRLLREALLGLPNLDEAASAWCSNGRVSASSSELSEFSRSCQGRTQSPALVVSEGGLSTCTATSRSLHASPLTCRTSRRGGRGSGGTGLRGERLRGRLLAAGRSFVSSGTRVTQMLHKNG